MSLKLKVLGLGLLAVMATSAFAVMNASAGVGGHFTHDGAGGHAILVPTESTSSTHRLAFVKQGSTEEGSEITCHKAVYTGSVTSATVQSVTIKPDWSNCTTGTTGSAASFEVDENGCTLTFQSGKAGQTHHTAQVLCPQGAAIVITHENCTITVPAQTVGGGGNKGGVTYTTTTENGKHALTMNVTVKEIVSQYHGGICIFLGTTQQSEMNGSVTVSATNTAGEAVNITETTG